MNLDTTAGGTHMGRIYGDATFVYLDIDLGNKFVVRNNWVNVFDVDATKATFVNPPECSTNCSAPSQLANKAYVDIASSKITTSQMPDNGTYYFPFLDSSTAGSRSALLDGNIYYDRTNNRLHVPNLSSYGTASFTNSPICEIAPTTEFNLVNKN